MFSSLPVTTFSTPGGSFSATRCTTRVVASGADGGGLTITVLPASSAWGSEAPRIAIGQLNGHDDRDHAERLVRHGRLDRDAGRDGEHLARVDLVGDASRARFQRISNTSASIHALECGSCRSPATGSRRPRLARRRSRRSPRPSVAARSVALSARPGRERGLRRGDRVGHVLLRSGCRVADDDSRLAGICDLASSRSVCALPRR